MHTITAQSGRTYSTTAVNAQSIYNASVDNGGIFDPTTCRQFTS